MTRYRRIQLLALLFSVAGWGCAAEPEISLVRRAVAGADAVVTDAPAVDGPTTDLPGADLPGADLPSAEQGASDLKPSADLSLCGAVTAKGCCDGETLWWCETGVLKSEHCGAKPKCGWNTSGYHDCNTSGSSDPRGVFPLSCKIGDASVPPSDMGGDGAAKPCGDVPLEGCCDGNTLRYCDDGALKVLSCAFNPSCGWFAQGKYYDCGTPGGADPSGAHPRVCAGSTPVDSGFDQGSDAAPAADLGGDTGGGSNGCSSCRVRGVEGTASIGADLGAALWVGLLAALLLALRRRASS